MMHAEALKSTENDFTGSILPPTSSWVLY